MAKLCALPANAVGVTTLPHGCRDGFADSLHFFAAENGNDEDDEGGGGDLDNNEDELLLPCASPFAVPAAKLQGFTPGLLEGPTSLPGLAVAVALDAGG